MDVCPLTRAQRKPGAAVGVEIGNKVTIFLHKHASVRNGVCITTRAPRGCSFHHVVPVHAPRQAARRILHAEAHVPVPLAHRAESAHLVSAKVRECFAQTVVRKGIHEYMQSLPAESSRSSSCSTSKNERATFFCQENVNQTK